MKPVVMILRIEGKYKRKQPDRQHSPDDVDADVEKRHEEPESLEGVTDKQDTDRSGIFGRDHLQNVEGDDSDKHHGENQECPGRSEGFEIVGFVKPDHEHWDTDDEGEGEVDPEKIINGRGVDDASRDSYLVVSEDHS